MRNPSPKKQLGKITTTLPEPFDWCWITGGEVVIESGTWTGNPIGGGTFQINQTFFTVASFWIAKYPTTNAQFQVFIDAQDGYQNQEWWRFSKNAMQWHKANPKPQKAKSKAKDVPRHNVSWYEAVAFCRWLSSRIDTAITLPTEQQWQRAAVGDSGWTYPWGNVLDATKCNYRNNEKQLTPVSWYDKGARPFGVFDMAGNVWEWCLSILPNDYVWPTNSRLEHSKLKAVRGGSFCDSCLVVRPTMRDGFLPHERSFNRGFRVVVSPE